MSPHITIVGLGPGDPRFLTAEAQNVLATAPEVYLRTRQHPVVPTMPNQQGIRSFDDLYEQACSFDDLYQSIATEVLRLGERPEGVIYAVPGHPLVGETSVHLILERAQERGLSVRLVDGLSFIEPVLSILQVDALQGLQLVDALDIAAQHSPRLDPDRPALLGQLYSREVASDVKLTLLNVYPAEHRLMLVQGAGTSAAQVVSVPLHELDRTALDHLTSLYLPPLERTGSLLSFQELIAHLRGPMGCPWDREQTHQSLRPHLLEETYEVLAALDVDDPQELKEELGDLLLQIMLHVQIASECGEFTMPDVVAYITDKLRRRHPHVFGEVVVGSTGEVLRNWEEIKRSERGSQLLSSAFAGVSSALPALARAQAIGERAARAGLDHGDLDSVWDQLDHSLRGLRAAETAEERALKLGEALWALVNVARWLQIDAESALREATARFMARVVADEETLHAGEHEPGRGEAANLWPAEGEDPPLTAH